MRAFDWRKIFNLSPRTSLKEAFPSAKPTPYMDLLELGGGCWARSLEAYDTGLAKFPDSHIVFWASNESWVDAAFGSGVPKKKREFEPPCEWLGVTPNAFTFDAIVAALSRKGIFGMITASYGGAGKFKYREYGARGVSLYLPSRQRAKDEPPGAVMWTLSRAGEFEDLRRMAATSDDAGSKATAPKTRRAKPRSV